MKVVIDIDEEDFKIMRHNVAVDNPLCPLSEKEMVTKVANGIPILDSTISKNVFDIVEKERLDYIDVGFEAKFINAITVPDGATNGEMVKAMFPDYKVQVNYICKEVSVYYDGTEEYAGSWFRFDLDWWDASYKKGTEEDD